MNVVSGDNNFMAEKVALTEYPVTFLKVGLWLCYVSGEFDTVSYAGPLNMWDQILIHVITLFMI